MNGRAVGSRNFPISRKEACTKTLVIICLGEQKCASKGMNHLKNCYFIFDEVETVLNSSISEEK